MQVLEEAAVGASRYRLLIIESQTLFGKALSALLADNAELEVVGDAPTIQAGLALGVRPDVILLDLDNHDAPIGPLAEYVRAHAPLAHICAIAATLAPRDIERCLQAGVEGFVIKDALPAELIRAAKMVAQGELYIDPMVAGTLLRRRLTSDAPPVELTARETDIVRLIADGLSNKEIGIRLSLSEKTVKSHLGRIFSKLKISGRTRAAVHAIKAGLA